MRRGGWVAAGVALIAAVGVALWLRPRGRPAAPRRAAARGLDGGVAPHQAPPTVSPPRRPALAPEPAPAAVAPSAPAPDAPDGGAGGFAGMPSPPSGPLPPRYQLVRQGPESVIVRLTDRGGLVSTSSTDAPAERDRVLRGRVLRADGAPAIGALVLAGSDLQFKWGHAFASYGDPSGPGGRFELAVPSGQNLAVVAISESLGWSTPLRVAAGTDRVDLELRLAAPGAVAGQVRRGGDPEVARVTLLFAERGWLETTSGPDGRYRIEPVPAGTYRLVARLEAGPGGGIGGVAGPVDLAVAAGETVTHDIDVAAGVVLVVELAGLPSGDQLSPMVWLLPGKQTIATFDDLLARGSGIGGLSTFQFEDQPPGPYTVCAVFGPGEADVRVAGCKQLDLAATPEVQEVTLDVSSPAGPAR